MADNVSANSIAVATRSVTYSGDASQNVQAVAPVLVSGSDDSKTATDVDGNSGNKSAGTVRVVLATDQPSLTNALAVTLAAGAAAIAKAEDVASVDADVGVPAMAVRKATPANTSGTDGDYEMLQVSAGRLWVSGDNMSGDVAHDGVDSGNPVKVGMRAVEYGSNPTAVAAADRTDWLASRAGIPFVIGGHPNIVSVKHTTITTAVTNDPIITVSTGTRIVVTSFMVTLDNASTVFPTVLLGFATATTPTTAGVIGAHGGVPAGGGFSRGDGSGIIGIGADNEDLRITTTGNATGNGLQVVVTYYTIAST